MDAQMAKAFSEAPFIECECGNKVFEEVVFFKRISKFVSPDQQEHTVPIAVHRCTECKEIPEFYRAQVPGGFPKEEDGE